MSDQPIRDAATLVIVDDSGPEPRVLMGRRRADQVFLPNVFVFPGGRVDACDADAPSADELDDDEAALLALQLDGSGLDAGVARGLALAAIRETFEETGLVLGSARAPGRDIAASGGWGPVLAHPYLPRLSRLQYFLRAITPPARPRRYDTRFFIVNARDIAHRGEPLDEELSEIGWFTMSALEPLDVPLMTAIAIDELRDVLGKGLAPAGQRRVPFYFEHNNVKHRAELSLRPARS